MEEEVVRWEPLGLLVAEMEGPQGIVRFGRMPRPQQVIPPVLVDLYQQTAALQRL